jgi:hypothetical protein
MGTIPTTAPAEVRSGGRGLLWAGVGLCLLGPALVAAQYNLGHVVVPWYLPALSTLGAFLLLCSLLRRLTVVRVVVLGLIAAVAAFEWFFLVSLARLPDYEGPARPGQQFPAFQTARADGSPFTDADLRDGRPSVLVFFRGRW